MRDDELHGLLMLAKIADLTGEARDAEKLRQALNPKRVIILVEMARHKKEAEESLRKIRAGHTKTVEYDLSPAMRESALRDKLVELGWTPPDTFTKEDRDLLEDFAHNNDMRCGSPTESDHLRDLAKRITPSLGKI